MKRHTKVMTLRMTEELQNKLSTIAEEKKLSVSEFTRKLCEEYISWQQEKVELSKVG